MGSQEGLLDNEILNRVVTETEGIGLELKNGEYGRMQGDSDVGKSNIVEDVLVDLEEYWEDINDRLMISRIVSESVIKGIVTAIEEEAAEKIAAKEIEVTNLKKFVRSYGLLNDKYVAARVTEMPTEFQVGISTWPCLADGCVLHEKMRELLHLGNLMRQQLNEAEDEVAFSRKSDSIKRPGSCSKLVGVKHEEGSEIWGHVDDKFERLKKTVDVVNRRVDDILFSRISVNEWQQDFPLLSKLEDTVIQTVLCSLMEELEGHLLEYNALFSGVKCVNWLEKFKGISCVKTQLDAILKELSTLETGFVSPGSHHDLDPSHHKAFINRIASPVLNHQGNGALDTSNIHVAESYDLQSVGHMTKDQLVNFFNDNITELRREHEAVLHQKTENYFSLKREYLKLASLVTHKKDGKFDLLRNKIIEVISKVDDFLTENERFPALKNNLENIEELKQRQDSLMHENHLLKHCLTENENEIRCLKAEVSDMREQVRRTMTVSPDSELEFPIAPDTCYGDAVSADSELIRDVESSDIESLMMLELRCLVFTEVMEDSVRLFHGLHKEALLDKEVITHLEAMVVETENELQLRIEERKILTQEMHALAIILEEKDKHMEDSLISLEKDWKQIEIASNELSNIRDDATKLQTMVRDTSQGFELLKSKLLEELKKIEADKLEINRLSLDLDQEKMLMTSTSDEINYREETVKKVLQMSASSFSTMFDDFESRASEKMKRSIYRLEDASCHLKSLTKTASELRKTEVIYKKIIERRCADLQMAETEVDLLGDEVDGLLQLLEKVYIALKHYFPVLKHYHGIVEILELIRRELNRDSTKLRTSSPRTC